MTAASRQAFLVRYIHDPAFEAKVRQSPVLAAENANVDIAFARWLAELDPRRVKAFRRSRAVKLRRRGS